jgi:hypothetical protein
MATVMLGPFLKQLADNAGLIGDEMRVGVITSNMGASGLPVCVRPDGTSWSDEAIVLSESSIEDCEDFPFMDVDTVGEWGGCYFGVDSYPESCPYLQFLRALSMSFDRPENEMFFRSEAHLLVIIFANRDDCSFTDGSFMLSDIGRVSSEVCCVTHREDLLAPSEMARAVSERVGYRGLTVMFFGGENHPVRIGENEHGRLVPVYEPCAERGPYDHVTPTPRIHEFLDELTRLRNDPELTFRFDTCAMMRWTEEEMSDLIGQLGSRVTR